MGECVALSLKIAYSWSTSYLIVGAQWLSGRVLYLRPRGSGFEPNQHHYIVVFEHDTFILA